jgi:hypothetical protein
MCGFQPRVDCRDDIDDAASGFDPIDCNVAAIATAPRSQAAAAPQPQRYRSQRQRYRTHSTATLPPTTT